MNPMVGGSSPPQVETFSVSIKNFDTFTRTPVHVSKMNAVARAQLTFQMLTLLLYIYIYIYIYKSFINGPFVLAQFLSDVRKRWNCKKIFRYSATLQTDVSV